jgi:hypothetical protein
MIVGSRYSPNTWRKTPTISPSVTKAHTLTKHFAYAGTRSRFSALAGPGSARAKACCTLASISRASCSMAGLSLVCPQRGVRHTYQVTPCICRAVKMVAGQTIARRARASHQMTMLIGQRFHFLRFDTMISNVLDVPIVPNQFVRAHVWLPPPPRFPNPKPSNNRRFLVFAEHGMEHAHDSGRMTVALAHGGAGTNAMSGRYASSGRQTKPNCRKCWSKAKAVSRASSCIRAKLVQSV